MSTSTEHEEEITGLSFAPTILGDDINLIMPKGMLMPIEPNIVGDSYYLTNTGDVCECNCLNELTTLKVIDKKLYISHSDSDLRLKHIKKEINPLTHDNNYPNMNFPQPEPFFTIPQDNSYTNHLANNFDDDFPRRDRPLPPPKLPDMLPPSIYDTFIEGHTDNNVYVISSISCLTETLFKFLNASKSKRLEIYLTTLKEYKENQQK